MLHPVLSKFSVRIGILVFATAVAGQSGLPADPASYFNEAKCKSYSILQAGPADSIPARVAEILGTRIEERSGLKPTNYESADCHLEITVRPGIGNEGFRIENVSHNVVLITGNDSRGLLYGVGKFLRGNTYQQGSFIIGSWRGTSVPSKPIRGVYIATHFLNYYQQAPIDQLQRYMEDLALWGFNLVIFDFDMHEFWGIQDSAAQAMLARMNVIARTAKNVGLQIGLGMAVNDAYQESPVTMRADWTAGHDGYTRELGAHYHLELCPNKPGAKELLLKWQHEVLQAFSKVGIDYVIPWPYDNGGCTCSQCKPWGVNGFLTLAEPIAEMARRLYPGCKTILSTWLFDHFTSGEFAGLEEKFRKEPPQWVDYILADDFESSAYAMSPDTRECSGVQRYSGHPPAHSIPGGFPMVNFPDVSMWGAFPWGGFGANPLPAHDQQTWKVGKDSLAGGFLYSEGIFDDLNKVIYAQLYWQKDRPIDSIVNEYIAYEFSPAVVAPMRRAIELLEADFKRTATNLKKGDPRFVLEHFDGAAEALSLFRQADRQLSARARASWRWRILYLRAQIDDELVQNDFKVSPSCEQALRELTGIYYAQRAILAVSPVTKEAIERDRKSKTWWTEH